MKRPRLKKSEEKIGSYFLAQSGVEFISTGCTVLDCCLGGGWPLGRVVNVVGDKSTGKTLLAIEACVNFKRKFPDGKIYYLEAEAAFDKRFAAMLGLPVDEVTFIEDCNTVEQLFRELETITAKARKEPVFFVVDSLDALSDEGEMDSDIDKGTYGSAKAKKMSQIFRRQTKRMASSKMLLMIISQVRDKLNVMFGKKTTRSGGKALNFYASQVLWLAEAGKITAVKEGIKRVTGVKVKATVEKNKVGLPYRSCQFEILFGYGVDSVSSGLEYLAEVGMLGEVDENLTHTKLKKYMVKLNRLDDDEYAGVMRQINKAVRRAWRRVETKFLPTRRKY